MGGVLSFGPSSLSERKTNLKNSKQQQRKEQKEREEKERIRRRLLEQYGVLIPPVFLANKSIDDAPISSRASEKIVEESSSARPDQPYYDLLSWAYRRKRKNNGNGDRDGNSGFDAGPLLAQTLLTEYMMPGLFFFSSHRLVRGQRWGRNRGGFDTTGVSERFLCIKSIAAIVYLVEKMLPSKFVSLSTLSVENGNLSAPTILVVASAFLHNNPG
mmetsp:Transcript_21065/g.46764  ORF Transcript_21065/g.46764 Transcript_21065/m.46764 type:complete len:215 (+) Transcript_21065:276-920(+)